MKLVRSKRMTVVTETGSVIPAWEIHGVGLNGKYQRYKLNVSTPEDANIALGKAEKEFRDAKSQGLTSLEAAKPVPLKDYFEKTYLPNAKGHLKANTYEKYIRVSKPIMAALGTRAVQHIRPKDIRSYLATRRTSRESGVPLSGSALNGERRLLSAVLGQALADELITLNPTQAVKSYHENKRERWLTPEEVGSLLAACDGASFEWLRPIIVIAVNTGMRVNEVLGLTWADAVNGTLRVTSERAKNRKTRHIPINRAVREVLEDMERRKVKSLKSSHIFVNLAEDAPYTVRGVDDAFSKARRIAGFESKGPDRVTFHTLRHTACSWMVQAGIPDRQIMAVLGHGSSRMVATYAHLAPKHLDKAATALDTMYASVPQNGDCSRIAQEVALPA